VATLIAVPILGALMVLQTSIVSRIPLLYGTADLSLLAIIAWALQKRVRTAWQWSLIGGLMFSLASALPLGAPIIGYSLSTGLALLLRQRIWQVPILAMLVTTFLCTLITQGIAFIALGLVGNPIAIGEAFNLIILPSVLINLLLAIPIYGLISDLAKWLYPEELEV
jgi:rod shape-determining protein MreD